MTTISDKRRTFRKLHEAGCFVIPNPWDIGSARYLQSLGFKALATTSAGFAFSQGLSDGQVPRDLVLRHCAELVEATDLPINTDFENGYAHDPAGVAENVRLCCATGVAGLSIEDSTGDRGKPIYDFEQAVARIRAARDAIDKSGHDVMLIGRAENFLVGRSDLDDTLARLKAYANAGADCLYAPHLTKREQIVAVVEAVAPKPVNVLIGGALGFTVDDMAKLGVRRISVGGAMARAAWGGFMRATRMIAEEGRFDAFADAASGAELNKLFRKEQKSP